MPLAQRNVLSICGFELSDRTEGGGEPSTIGRLILTAATGNIYIGDAVTALANGTIGVATTPGTDKYAGVALTTRTFGSAASSADQGGTGQYVDVVFASENVYEIQAGPGAPTAVVQADMFANANIKLDVPRGPAAVAGNLSGQCLDPTTIATTATFDLRILNWKPDGDVVNVLNNTANGGNARLKVMLNRHYRSALFAGLGV